jgi:zinc protease
VNRPLATFVAALSALSVSLLSGCATQSPPPPALSWVRPAPPPPPPPVASPVTEDPSVGAPPATSDDWPARSEAGQTFLLPNGMRVALVERHGIPYVVARLGIELPSAPKDPQADIRRALVREVFLQARDAVGQPVRYCGSVDCGVLARGASSELGDILEREAAMVRNEPAAPEAERLLAHALQGYAMVSGDFSSNAQRSATVLLFGYDHPYAMPAVAPQPPTLRELRQWRQTAFVPGSTTLVLVGDVTLADAKALVTRHFGDWRSKTGPRTAPPAFPPLPDEAHAFFTQNDFIPVDYAAVVARGPAWSDPDVAAVLVATSLFQTSLPRPTPCREMEGRLPTSRGGVPLSFLPGGSVVTLGGSFAPKTAVASIGSILEAIRASRDLDASEDALARAKRKTVADWRRREEDWTSLSGTVATVLETGGALESAFGLEDKIASVRAADVRRVAQRYFGEDALRVVIIGQGRHFADLQELRVGGAGKVDPFARPFFRAAK